MSILIKTETGLSVSLFSMIPKSKEPTEDFVWKLDGKNLYEKRPPFYERHGVSSWGQKPK